MMRFAEKYIRAREKAGLNDTQLSILTGIGKNSLSGYRNGNHIPKPEQMLRLAQALNVPLRYFTEEEEESEIVLLKPTQAAKMLKVPEYMLRTGIENGEWSPSIGSALSGKGERKTYHIPLARVKHYLMIND